MMYKLINTLTKEEYLCEKITVDGFDYYVSNSEQPKIDGELYHCKNKGKGIDVGYGQPPQVLVIDKYTSSRNLCSGCKKIIATNNPNIDLPYIISEVEYLADNYIFNENGHKFSNNNNEAGDNFKSFKDGFNKAKESYQFTQNDMIEFTK